MPKHFWRGTWSGRSPSGTGHQRAREILRPTGGIMRGKFPSRKNGRMVQHEGLLELDAIYLFEAHPGIAAYREQPCTVRYPDGARLRRYTPDFEVILSNGEASRLIVELLGHVLADALHLAAAARCGAGGVVGFVVDVVARQVGRQRLPLRGTESLRK